LLHHILLTQLNPVLNCTQNVRAGFALNPPELQKSQLKALPKGH